MTAPPVIALLGLGEAGSAIAADLVAAGVTVRGFDPAARGARRRRAPPRTSATRCAAPTSC